jgi:hypothetical protein
MVWPWNYIPTPEEERTVRTRTNAAVKLLGSAHKEAIQEAIEEFVCHRHLRHIPSYEKVRGPRAVGRTWGAETPTLKRGNARVARAVLGLKRSIYDSRNQFREDVSSLELSDFPLDAMEMDWWIERLSAPLPHRARYDFDLAFGAELAGRLWPLTDEKPSLGRSPNNKFVKLTGIICGRRLKGCPRPCQEVIKKLLLATRREQPTK